MVFEIVGYIFIFLIGLSVGSFLKVVADRTCQEKKFLFGRSKCDECGEKLGTGDLFPIVSYVLSKGRCRHCNSKISLLYPISELLTGSIFVGIAILLNVFGRSSVGIWISFFYLVLVASFYIIIFLADVKYRVIPNKVVIPAIVILFVVMILGLGFAGYSSYQQLSSSEFGRYLLKVGYWNDYMISALKGVGITTVSSLGLGFFFWLLIVITRGKGMGGGDVKLAILIGLFNGFPNNIVAIVLAFVTGALYSAVMMVVGKKGIKDTIPFGPFLIIGSVIAFFTGRILINWYMGFI